MPDTPAPGPPLSEHPELRESALALEGAGVADEIIDAHWQIVFISSESARLIGAPW